MNVGDNIPHPYGIGVSKEGLDVASWTEPEILGKQLTDQDHLLFNTSLETLVTRCILAVPKTGLMGIDIFSMNILSSVPPSVNKGGKIPAARA